MIKQNNMRWIEDVVKARFESLPQELKNSPEALLEWTLTTTFQQIAQLQEEGEPSADNRYAATVDRLIENNPTKTGHELVAAAQ